MHRRGWKSLSYTSGEASGVVGDQSVIYLHLNFYKRKVFVDSLLNASVVSEMFRRHTHTHNESVWSCVRSDPAVTPPRHILSMCLLSCGPGVLPWATCGTFALSQLGRCGCGPNMLLYTHTTRRILSPVCQSDPPRVLSSLGILLWRTVLSAPRGCFELT